ncbi:MAG: tRNA glutamyl-Q(34) synthetase GluQRS [Betaproteobacteria bacterium]
MNDAAALRCIGRFAPSPTGPLHFGSLIAALASYADARARQGQWLLRIEDLDPPREHPGAAESFPRVLEYFGFTWDGPILRQSRRHDAYESALAQLAERGKVFPCACSRLDLESSATGIGGERVYPGTCRQGLLPGRSPRAWRMRVGNEPVDFVDRLQGAQQQVLARDVGDFVVKRADGFWGYQLAVVVDDAAQGVTDVVRGADLLASTPRQIWLQRELGLPQPHYLHVPVAINSDGEKLSKQTLARPLPMSDPLPVLINAWRFLDQAWQGEEFANVREFWEWAIPRWDVRRLPPVAMLTARTGKAGGL